MERDLYLKLAREGVRLPICADLILHEHANPEQCRLEGDCLGRAILESARRFHLPLAIPLMDLSTEKEWLLQQLQILNEDRDRFQFTPETLPDQAQMSIIADLSKAVPSARMRASLDAIQYVKNHSELIAVGMCIGPFSFMTKLVCDPITAAFMASVDPDGEESVFLHAILRMSTTVILQWIQLQIEAGADAIFLCEPAYNTVYLSPHQMVADPDMLDNLVMQYLHEIKQFMDQRGVDLLLHDCGELNESIIQSFNALDPAILSLGSSTNMQKATTYVSKNTVLMGNLPSKKFYSDSELDTEGVRVAARSLLENMKATGHPFILGTECDVLCVAGCESTLMQKIYALVNC